MKPCGICTLTPASPSGTIFMNVFTFYLNPVAPGDFAEKRVLKLVEWFSGHCRAIKS